MKAEDGDQDDLASSPSSGMGKIVIEFDGGCRPTNPGNKYGSYEIQLEGRSVFRANRIELGWGTNNEAEFDTLIRAVKDTLENLAVGGFEPSNYSVCIFTDSTILRNRMLGSNRTRKSEPQQRMSNLTNQALALLSCFNEFSVTWRGR